MRRQEEQDNGQALRRNGGLVSVLSNFREEDRRTDPLHSVDRKSLEERSEEVSCPLKDVACEIRRAKKYPERSAFYAR